MTAALRSEELAGNTAAADCMVGDAIATALADLGVTTVFGVISIHNIPILDAIARQGRIRFVPARGEAGAFSMADAYARVSDALGVVFTSTGTAAGNAAGSQVEALTAGSPVLHITTQVDREFVDRDRAAIHDVPRQPDMLKAISKSYFRVWEPRSTIHLLEAAAQAALRAPAGPVTYEIPVDVQRLRCRMPAFVEVDRRPTPAPGDRKLDLLAQMVMSASRPMLWLGGGARGARAQATRLAEMGFGIVASTNGRAVVDERHPNSLGAFNMTPEAEAVYAESDLMIVVGSKLRGNETLNNTMRLPRRIVQVDADPLQAGKNYEVELFVEGDAGLVLDAFAGRLEGKFRPDNAFLRHIAEAHYGARARLKARLGPYGVVADTLCERIEAGGHPFVRDVTVANSTFGNRYVRLASPRLGVHALGGGIGQGIAMAIGAALGAPRAKTIALIGDGGSMLNIGELATAAEAGAGIVYLLMNDRGYGVIRNIQDAQYGGRRHYVDLRTPDFGKLAKSIGMPHRRLSRLDTFGADLDAALAADGPFLLEIDMVSVGPFATAFAGPPAGAAGSV